MDGPKFHEYQCKLYCLSVEAKYVIETLLGFYSVQSNIATSNGITDPNEAFTAIVKHCHNNNTLKNVKMLSYTNYKQQCFDLNIPIQVKTEINIKELDITISCDFLRNLDIFPTCRRPYKKQLAMAEAVVFIKDVRNFTAHLTFDAYEKMEKGDFSCINITGCLDWNDVLVKYVDAIKTVLRYLRSVLGISIYSRCNNLDIIVTKNYEVYWNIYTTSSMNRVIRENFAMINSKDYIIKRTFNIDLDFTKVEAAGFWGYLSRVGSLFTSYEQQYFNTRHIGEPYFMLICKVARKTVEKTVFAELNVADNSGKFEIVVVVNPNHFELFSICMSIHIEFRKEPPECYDNRYSTESRSLQKQIKIALAEAVRTVLKQDFNVVCTRWNFTKSS